MFPAKLFLFGEYSILLGSQALSIPLKHFTATLRLQRPDSDNTEASRMASNHELCRMYEYFVIHADVFGSFLNLDAFVVALSEGLYLDSSIPQRYGVGSSGALCAAIYNRFRHDRNEAASSERFNDVGLLRSRFIRMESFFHGKSSGFDPLVSFMKVPLMLSSAGEVNAVDLSQSFSHSDFPGLLLVDSGSPCSTGPLVAEFMDAFSPKGTVTAMGTELCSLVNTIIDRLIAGDVASMTGHITRLSHFQLKNLSHLIPVNLIPSWIHGIETGLFAMKLCGSGGGGFLLCFTLRHDDAIDYFKSMNLRVVDVLQNGLGE